MASPFNNPMGYLGLPGHPSLSAMAGPGLPNSAVGGAPGHPSVGGMMGGPGLPGSGVTGVPSHPGSSGGYNVGGVTSTGDPFGNPRQTVATPFMIDLAKMNPALDIGNMELCWMDVLGDPGTMESPDKPYVFKSLRAMNEMLKAKAARDEWGPELNTHWFDRQYSFVGVLRHDMTPKDADSMGTVKQLFASAFRTRVVDVWMSYGPVKGLPKEGIDEIGPLINDTLHIVLRRFKYTDELKRTRPKKEEPEEDEFYWQLVPMFTRDKSDAEYLTLYNPADKSIGRCYRIGRVVSIYGVPTNALAARGVARNYVFNTFPGGPLTYRSEILKLRHLEIDLTAT
jgi:hypothetical protein